MEKSEIYLLAVSVRALIEALGMQAENQKRRSQGAAPAYDEKSFVDLVHRNGLGENQLLNQLYSR